MFFILPKKAFPFLRYLNFCPVEKLFSHVEKRLDKKVKVNFKISNVINWKLQLVISKVITIHILPIILRSKGNQTKWNLVS